METEFYNDNGELIIIKDPITRHNHRIPLDKIQRSWLTGRITKAWHPTFGKYVKVVSEPSGCRFNRESGDDYTTSGNLYPTVPQNKYNIFK